MKKKLMNPFSFGKYWEEKYCHWPLLELFMYTLCHNRRKSEFPNFSSNFFIDKYDPK